MDLKNKQLGAYRLISLVGKGGMAEVWLGSQLALNREVAVKILPVSRDGNDELRLVERFDREARAIAQLDHPAILPVIDYGSTDEYLYLVMPYVRGGSLQERIKRELLTRQQAFYIFEQVLGGLSFAHRKGIVHRDLKPGNILLYDERRAVLADFGLAKTLEEDVSLTKSGLAVGSPEYMAPEQFMGHSDYRSDLYAMGVILYQLLTGHPLYSGTTSWEIALRHMNDPLPLPHPSVPVPLERFLTRVLDKRPEQRFATAEEMELAFHIALNSLSMEELQYRPPRPNATARQPHTPDRPAEALPTTPMPAAYDRAAYDRTLPRNAVTPQALNPIPPQPTPPPMPQPYQSPPSGSNYGQLGYNNPPPAPGSISQPSQPVGAVSQASSGFSPDSIPVPQMAQVTNTKKKLPVPLIAGIGAVLLLIITAIIGFAVLGSSSNKIAIGTPAAPTVPAGVASLTVQLNAQNGTKVSGTGVIIDGGGTSVRIILTMSGLEPGNHNAHVHGGSCLAQGPIMYPLTPLEAGPDGRATSTTTVQAAFATITGGNLYLNVHNQANTPTYVASCGDIAT